MKRGTARPDRARWRSFVGASLLLAAVACRDGNGASERPPADGPPPRPADLATHPPVARSMSVRLLEPATGAGQLLINYAPDPRLGPRVRLRLGAEPVEVRDDGAGGDEVARDGIYTGPTRIDVEALIARWSAVARLMREPGFTPRLPRFDGREITGTVEIPPLDVEALRTRLLERRPVPLDLTATCAVDAIEPKASLFVTHPDVVTDPARTWIPCGPSGPRGTAGGVWSFGHLVRQLAGGPTATDAQVSGFIGRWLDEWGKTGNGVNGWPLPARLQLATQVVQPWKTASAGSGVDFHPDKAPFRLLAIVNRIDLSKSAVYGGDGAGEVRFVFGALSSSCQPLKATVIFEYGVDRGGCLGLSQWARSWVALSGLTLGSAGYRDALEALTAQVTTPGALGQLRTNELSFADPARGAEWDLREFHLAAGALVQRTVAQTPQHVVNETDMLRDYVNANAAAIDAETYTVPLALPSGLHFRGDHAFGQPVLGRWNATGILPHTAPDGTVTPASELRHDFSRNTCNGCHNVETGTASVHVNPMLDPDAASQLSGFLTGITGVADPVDSTITYEFGDLDRRKLDLAAAAAPVDCLCQLLRFRIDAPH